MTPSPPPVVTISRPSYDIIIYILGNPVAIIDSAYYVIMETLLPCKLNTIPTRIPCHSLFISPNNHSQLWTCYKIILFDLADEVYDEVEDFGGDGLAYLAIFGGFAGDGVLHEVVESRHQARVGIRDE